MQVSKTFEILNSHEATIYESKLRTIIFAEKLLDRSRILILQLKRSYIDFAVQRCYSEMSLCCRIRLRNIIKVEQLLLRQPICLEIITEVELIIQFNNFLNETETYPSLFCMFVL